MRARLRLLTAAASALPLAAGCGDPVSIVGDIPGLMRIVAGIPETPGRTADGRAVDSRISGPAGLALDASGVLYVAERTNARVIAVGSSGRLRVLRDDFFCAGPDCLEEPAGLALDPAGRVLVADPAGNRVWRLDPDAGTAEAIAGTGERASAPDGAVAAESPLVAPYGVAVDEDGTIFVSESGAARVRSIDSAGRLATVAGTGDPGFSGDGGPAVEARLALPQGLALGPDGLYVADSGNDRVRLVRRESGTIATVAGNGVRGFGGDGGRAVDAALNLPEDVAVAPDGGRLFIADTGNHRVRDVSLASGRIETRVGNGTTAWTGDLLDAGATSLSSPRGVATSPFGLLFVSDPGHALVWRLALTF
ncbi:MAG: hypothetical protein R6X22_01870 [Gemmatimonadota bacterium]